MSEAASQEASQHRSVALYNLRPTTTESVRAREGREILAEFRGVWLVASVAIISVVERGPTASILVVWHQLLPPFKSTLDAFAFLRS